MEEKKAYIYEIGINTDRPITVEEWARLVENVRLFLQEKGYGDNTIAYDEYDR
jgi:hypothetical protein